MLFAQIAATLALAAAASAARLAVPVAADGSYSVVVDGKELLGSADTFFRDGNRTFSSGDGTLKLLSATTANASGADSGGAYSGTALVWQLVGSGSGGSGGGGGGGGGGGKTVRTAVRVYAAHAVFEQSFPDALDGTAAAAGRDDVISSFPSFRAPAAKMGTLAFQGDQGGKSTKTATWGGGSSGSSSGSSRSSSSSSTAVDDAPHQCRLSGAAVPFVLKSSRSGFDAYLPEDGAAPRDYAETKGSYCGRVAAAGPPLHAPTVFEGPLTLAACRAKCDALSCACLDFESGGGGGGGGGGGPVPGGITGSGPLVLFDSQLATTVVISAFSNFMAHSLRAANTSAALHYGVMGGVTALPAGYSIATVLALGNSSSSSSSSGGGGGGGGGINGAMDDLGALLLARTGKQRYAWRRDPALQRLGYSTDNGAYYYYQVLLAILTPTSDFSFFYSLPTRFSNCWLSSY